MATYDLEMWDECGSSETVEVRIDDLSDIRIVAEEEVEEWVRGGEWGIDGASIPAHWSLTDEDGDEIDSGFLYVEIEPDHDALIKAAGGDTDCEHVWTGEGEGGCDQNPGVWGGSGTAISVARHCRKCGLHRVEYCTGSQKNPGEHDTVSYEQPESWCSECEREECCCKED